MSWAKRAAQLHSESTSSGYDEAMSIDNPQQRINVYLLRSWFGRFTVAGLAHKLDVSQYQVRKYVKRRNLSCAGGYYIFRVDNNQVVG